MSDNEVHNRPPVGSINYLNNLPDRTAQLVERSKRREEISRRVAALSVQLYREQQQLKRSKWWSEFKPT